eukprot:scaffold10736_cov70-Phaeocystis_antarctica.AAC.5
MLRPPHVRRRRGARRRRADLRARRPARAALAARRHGRPPDVRSGAVPSSLARCRCTCRAGGGVAWARELRWSSGGCTHSSKRSSGSRKAANAWGGEASRRLLEREKGKFGGTLLDNWHFGEKHNYVILTERPHAYMRLAHLLWSFGVAHHHIRTSTPSHHKRLGVPRITMPQRSTRTAPGHQGTTKISPKYR